MKYKGAYTLEKLWRLAVAEYVTCIGGHPLTAGVGLDQLAL